MREILTRKRDIAAAVARFRRAIAALDARPRKAEWVFPNGVRETIATYTIVTRSGRLLVGLPARAGVGGRVPHLLRLDRDDGGLTPDIEINIVPALERKVSGVYLRDGKSLWLATRGRFTAYRGTLTRERVFQHFEKWLIDTADGNARAQVIPVAALDSPTLADDVADFVRAVVALKSDYRHGEGSAVQTGWRENEAGYSVAEIGANIDSHDDLHGPLCSTLEARLLALTHMSARHKVCRNSEIDVALVDARTNRACAIFEVRTTLTRGAALHAAVGRLLCHRHIYGNVGTLLFIALAPDAITQALVFKEFFKTLRIVAVVRDGHYFRTPDGTSLAQLLDTVLAV
jgi:hypothetical protein